MFRTLIFTIGILLSSFSILAQAPDQFSEDEQEFLKQLESYVTASKVKAQEDLFKEFKTICEAGVFSPEEIAEIRKTSNGMLALRMSANPYFSNFLQNLLIVKEAANGEARFANWISILQQMLEGAESRKKDDFNDFLRFSESFFSLRALRYSQTGINWIADGDNFTLDYLDEEPVIQFDRVNLIGTRKQDSIVIYQTTGTYYPVREEWHGDKGKVTWERLGLKPEVFAELGPYEIQIKQSIYKVNEAKLYYPQYFGSRVIVGKFEDKLTVSNRTTEGSYPRFESKEAVVEVENLGEGIRYLGGFRLQGTTVYGYGSKENPAELTLFNERKVRTFKALAELFIIRREERIVGERVACTVYVGEDSLYHPSVNFRFEIPDRKLQLNRGDRGSDRNPFYSSLHQINIEADNINYYVDQDSILIGEKNTIFADRKSPVVFESLKFFEEGDYYRYQNISTYNPIAVIKAVAEVENRRVMNANYLAERLDSRFSVENIQSLLYDLVSKGFVSYDPDKEEVEVKDKIFHYANASQKKVDYDYLRLESETSETNAVFNLNNNTILANGISNVMFSPIQKVGLKPYGEQLVLKENRNMDFDGRLFAGFSVFSGKDFHFDYDPFQIRMDSVEYFDLFLPTGNVDPATGKEEALSIASRIEYLNGVLLIDAPSNKSGRDSISIFPSLQSKDYSFVYYDRTDTQGGVYKRDSFYFRLEPFSFNSLDRFGRSDVSFKGTLFSADIFPDIDETLVLQQSDESLGFETETPAEGYDVYQGKGNYKGGLSLSNQGLLGKGALTYLGSTINSEDFIFKPKQLTASAERFYLEEDRSGEVEVPQASGVDVTIDWRPYRDSMYVSSQEAPFDLFTDQNHKLEGKLILTPGGLKGRGEFFWDKASMSSKLFSFGAYSVTADTSVVRIKAFDSERIALETANLKSDVDFEKQFGTFVSNDPANRSQLPFNAYETSMNDFDWDMKEELIIFNLDDEGGLGSFLSTQPDQDSLWFQGKTAAYHIPSSELRIGGVPHIVSADAYIIPSDGKVLIKQDGQMDSLVNVQIIADTLTKHHVINRATAHIKGKKDFLARGFYQYNIGNKEQEIEFQNIVGQRVGKGNFDEKGVATRATGKVEPVDRFYIDHKTEFRGTISLFSETKNLYFEGFARMDADIPNRHWFSVASEGDKENLMISFDKPKNYNGESLYTGLYLSKETARIYPRVMAPLYFRKDRPVLPVTGLFNYDKIKDRFIFGDSTKVTMLTALKGNQVIFHNKTGEIDAEGRFNLGTGLKYVSIDAAGRAQTDAVVETDTIQGGPLVNSKLEAEFMLGLKLLIPENLMKMVVNDFESTTFDAQQVLYASDPTFYKKATAELFPDNADIRQVIDGISLNSFSLPKKYNEYDFLFSRVPMKWDPDYQSFVSTRSVIALASIDGNPFDRMVTAYIECKMPINEDDRLYIYLRSPSGFYYFFGYKGGILSMVSNNTKFNDEVINMKEKNRVTKMDDGETFEILAVEPSTASAFVRRVEAANQN